MLLKISKKFYFYKNKNNICYISSFSHLKLSLKNYYCLEILKDIFILIKICYINL